MTPLEQEHFEIERFKFFIELFKEKTLKFTAFYNCLDKCFQQGVDKHNTNLRYDENRFFFVYQKALFQVGDGVEKIKEGSYYTLGAGMDEAAMCMHLGLTPKEAVLKTIEMNVWTANGCQEVIINKQ